MRAGSFGVIIAAFSITLSSASAEDLRNTYKPRFLAPQTITNPCVDLAQTFVELRAAIDITGAQSAAAGGNAIGLGYFSPNKHFRSIEDNYIVVNRVLEPTLDEVSDIPIVIDQVPDSPAKVAALGLAESYEKSLRQIKQYAHAAVVFERSAHGRRNAQASSFGLYSGGAEKRNANDRELSADQARSILDGESSDVKDASRVLKLPEFRWHKACPDAPIPHRTVTDSMNAPSEPDVRPNPKAT